MTLDEFKARTSRFERYRFADKSLRFFGYRDISDHRFGGDDIRLSLT